MEEVFIQNKRYTELVAKRLKEFHTADAGNAFRELAIACMQVFKERLVDCEESNVKLWRGGILAFEVLLHELEEASAFAEIIIEEEEVDDASFGYDTRGL